MLFLTFLVNVLMMVHKNQDLLRASIMSAGNSHRLGANEAPPAILSIFLGSQLSATLDEIVRQVTNSKMTPEEKTTLKLGIGVYPKSCSIPPTVIALLLLHSREIVLSSVPPDPQPTVLLP